MLLFEYVLFVGHFQQLLFVSFFPWPDRHVCLHSIHSSIFPFNLLRSSFCPPSQGCQMGHFQAKNPYLGKFGRVL
jgi:hypothetical protein